MSFALALTLAAALADQPVDMEARAKAFVGALLSSDSTDAPPHTRTGIKYVAYGNAAIARRELPVVESSLAGFRKALRGCTIDFVHADDGSSDYKIRVFVSLNCPNDLAHANNELALNLVVLGDGFVEADMQVGPPVPITPTNTMPETTV